MKKSISLLLIFTMLTGLFIAYANDDIIPVNTDENVITEQQLTNSDETGNSSNSENNIPSFYQLKTPLNHSMMGVKINSLRRM